jgi:uncharacterized protein YjdB
MKKLYVLFLLAFLPLAVHAAVEINGIYYNIVTKTKEAEVTSHPNSYSGSVVIPKTVTYNGVVCNVTSIGSNAFSYDGQLTSVTIPNTVTKIGSDAFCNCDGLTSITIPSSVTEIVTNPFRDCDALYSIKVASGNPTYDSRNSCNAIIKKETNELIVGCKNTIIPNSVTTIGYYAFSSCGNLTSITIPNSVTTIENYAFNYCGGITSITIPNTVTRIGDSAFYHCYNLTSITIPSSVTSIGDHAFADTPWFDAQPDGFIYIGKVLYKYKGTMPDNTDVNIKKGTTCISGYAFQDCGGLNSVSIPSSVTEIGYRAFYNCDNLGTVMIGNGVSNLGGYSFAYCENLMDVYCFAEAVPVGGYSYFDSSYPEYATLHVPTGSVDAYKSNYYWNKFGEIVGITAKVKLSKSTASLKKGKTLTLTPTVTPSVLSDKSVTWKSSNTKVATVSSSGKVKGVSVGTATITCTSVATGAKGTCKVTIYDGSVTLSKSEAFVEKGKTVTLKATVEPSTSDQSVTWKCSDTSVATVSSSGKVKGVKAGTATITCTSSQGAKATCKVVVGYVELNMTEAIIKKGKTQTLKATVYPSTLEDKSVTWKSSNTAVATVSSTGKVKGVKAGTATITCTSVATGLSSKCKVTVGYVKLGKTKLSVKKGNTVTLTSTVYPSSLSDKSVTWKSSNTSVATVTSSGKVKGVKAGTATITCTSVATGLSADCEVTVGYVKLDKSEVSVEKGKTLTLTATVYPSSLSDKSVTWESSNTSVATVTSTGKVKGIKTGMAVITCTSDAMGLSTTCIVTVINGSVSLNKTEVALLKGKTVTLKATLSPATLEDKSVTWVSSDTKIATVTSGGKVKAVKEGIATITCTSVATGLSATCTVIVGKVVIDMPELILRKNGTVTLNVNVYPTSLSDKSVTWKSSDATVATVTSAGKVKGIKAGTATITCTSIATGLSGTCEVTVLASSSSRSMDGDDDDTTGIQSMEDDPAEIRPYDVYDLSGRKVRHQVNSLDGLPNGVYIVNGKKVLKK